VSWTFLELKPAALVAVHTNSPVSRPEGELRRRLPSGSREKAGPPRSSCCPAYNTHTHTHTEERKGFTFFHFIFASTDLVAAGGDL